jgi:hypothetical protein
MGISQKEVYITLILTKKDRIIHRDVTASGGHIRGRQRGDSAARISLLRRFHFVNFYKNESFFLYAVHKFLVSLPLVFSKQKAKMMAQKLGAAKPAACPNPQL